MLRDERDCRRFLQLLSESVPRLSRTGKRGQVSTFDIRGGFDSHLAWPGRCEFNLRMPFTISACAATRGSACFGMTKNANTAIKARFICACSHHFAIAVWRLSKSAAFTHRGVGRGCGVGRGLGVTLGEGVDDGVGVGVAVGLGVGVGVGVDVEMSSQVSLKYPLLS